GEDGVVRAGTAGFDQELERGLVANPWRRRERDRLARELVDDPVAVGRHGTRVNTCAAPRARWPASLTSFSPNWDAGGGRLQLGAIRLDAGHPARPLAPSRRR